MMNGYKATEFGDIPESWNVVKSNQIFDLVHGYQFRDYDFSSSGLPIIKIGSIKTNGSIDLTDCSYFDEQRAAEFEDIKIYNGDVLMALTGATLGKTCFVAGLTSPVYQNYRVGRFEPIDDSALLKRYLYYLISSDIVLKQIFAKVSAGAQGNIGKSDFDNLRIPLPSISEQKNISEILSTVDDKINIINARIVDTENLKKGLMQRLFSKGIGHDCFVNSDIGDIPKGWAVKKVGDFADITSGGTPNTSISEYWNGDIPWMNSGDINQRRVAAVEGRITEAGLKNSSTKLVPPNSILIALAGQGKTRGKVAINEIQLCTNQSLGVILNLKDVDHEFLFQNLENRYLELRKMSTGDGGRGGLNLAILKSIKVALPPLDEQKKIANILKTVDEKVEILRLKKSSFHEFKQGLMQQLLTGKIRANTYQQESAVA